MNPFPRMDATPPEEPDPAQTAQAHRARLILMIATAVMIGLPILLFILFHT